MQNETQLPESDVDRFARSLGEFLSNFDDDEFLRVGEYRVHIGQVRELLTERTKQSEDDVAVAGSTYDAMIEMDANAKYSTPQEQSAYEDGAKWMRDFLIGKPTIQANTDPWGKEVSNVDLAARLRVLDPRDADYHIVLDVAAERLSK